MIYKYQKSPVCLDLCYRTVPPLTESTNPDSYFRDFIFSIIQEFVYQFPDQNEQRILRSPKFPQVVRTFVQLILLFIESLRIEVDGYRKRNPLFQPRQQRRSAEFINQISIFRTNHGNHILKDHQPHQVIRAVPLLKHLFHVLPVPLMYDILHLFRVF